MTLAEICEGLLRKDAGICSIVGVSDLEFYGILMNFVDLPDV